MKFLNEAEYHLQYEKNEADQITRLFFSKISSQHILKINHEVLLMNCTYKTNKYRLSLLVICGVTTINTTFYVIFCFLSSEYIDDYTWMLRQFQKLYQTFDISSSKVAVTNREQILISALWVIYSEMTLVFCLWHVQKSVLKNCKFHFVTEEQWIYFQQAFNEIIFAATQENFDNVWNRLQNTYMKSHLKTTLYIFDIWWHYRTKYVKFWINQMTHFNNNITSRVKRKHRTLKRSLRFFIDRSQRACFVCDFWTFWPWFRRLENSDWFYWYVIDESTRDISFESKTSQSTSVASISTFYFHSSACSRHSLRIEADIRSISSNYCCFDCIVCLHASVHNDDETFMRA